MPDDKPFVLFGVEVLTVYSCSLLPKRYENFRQFHSKLSYFWNNDYKKGKLINLLPRLPGITGDLNVDKEMFSGYINKILGILQNSSFNQYHPWIKLINQFLDTKKIVKNEEAKAAKIQNFFKTLLVKKTLNGSARPATIAALPLKLFQSILLYLPYAQLSGLVYISKDFYRSVIVVKNILILKIPKPQSKALAKLEFYNCDLIDTSALALISQHCDGSVLKELKLIKCRYVNDTGILALAARYKVPYGVSKGGARGLEALSLSYTSVQTSFIKPLQKLKSLKRLDLSGCNIRDDTLYTLTNCLKTLSTLNLSDTEITNNSLEAFKTTNFLSVTLKRCKSLKLEKINEVNEKVFTDIYYANIHSRSPSYLQFQIKGTSFMTVSDIVTFLRKKLNTSDDIVIDIDGKVLNSHQNLESIGTGTNKIDLFYKIVSKDWTQLPKWVDAKLQKSCTACQKVFKWVDSKINCRNCGKVCCKACTKGKGYIHKYGYSIKKVPICSICINYI